MKSLKIVKSDSTSYILWKSVFQSKGVRIDIGENTFITFRLQYLQTVDFDDYMVSLWFFYTEPDMGGEGWFGVAFLEED